MVIVTLTGEDGGKGWTEQTVRIGGGILLFSGSKPCSACSRVFVGDIYGDHVVSCAGIIGIKHRHNVVRDTLVDICYRSGISAGLDVCVDLTGYADSVNAKQADYITEADPEVLHGSGHWGTCCCLYINMISFAIAKGVGPR
nr:hypothetical protein [Tanacetum cinerariifolium]